MAPTKGKAARPEWTSEAEAFHEFATHSGKTQSAKHIKPLHWYVACRLVIEGGFHPDNITPRPPFRVDQRRSKGESRVRHVLCYDESRAEAGEQVILGGLKTKNVDVVVDLRHVGPVLAVSCKGVTKAFRNLTNRMEETIGECTNLHITYPALVVGYFAVMRANRTQKDVEEAPEIDVADAIVTPADVEQDALLEQDARENTSSQDPLEYDNAAEQGEAEEDAAKAAMTANDIAIGPDGRVLDSIVRFHAALSQMTGRRGIRDEISRYEAMTIVLVEPTGPTAGSAFDGFPELESELNLQKFFDTLYLRYEERFVYGAPLLADRGITTRYAWDPASPVLTGINSEGIQKLNYRPRVGPA